ncbi:beta-1,4-galactosyltransferase 4-like isoform X2 [Argopecten irradians]
MKLGFFRLSLRRWRRIKIVLLLLVFVFCICIVDLRTIFSEISFALFGHPNFAIELPVRNLDSCHQEIHFLEHQSVNEELEITLEYLEVLYGNRSLGGGHFTPVPPDMCSSVGRTAVILPYRNRKKHLLQYLYHVLPKLIRQQIDFTIFVIEQNEGSTFNRGMIRNIGFVEVMKYGQYDCFIFNDVDTVIEDDRNVFYCNPSAVRHLMSGLDRHNYRMPYFSLVGGIIGFTPEQFKKINGYSNLFFLWGAEDDDLYRRIIAEDLMIERPPNPIGYVTTLKHKQDPVSDARLRIYRSLDGYYKSEGLNSLEYKLLDIHKMRLFTRIYVDVDENAIRKRFF